MNLPKQIEERFDEKFNKPINDEIHRYLNNANSRYCFYDNTEIKSFIAQILEEEKERLVREIENKRSFPAEMFQLNNLKMPFVVQEGKADENEKFHIFRTGFQDAISQIINLIKK